MHYLESISKLFKKQSFLSNGATKIILFIELQNKFKKKYFFCLKAF